jgi:hypothetical protein
VKHSIALAALVATTIGFTTVLPAIAQDQPTQVANNSGREVHRMVNRDGGGMGRGAGILGLVCSDRGAEALEIAFVRMSHNLDLTAEQTPLFDTFKTKALTTQTSFADACKAAMPDKSADAKPDLLERLKAGVAVDEARLAAITAVLPDFEAFYGSLTDAQKANLMPGHDRGDDRGMGRGDDRGGPGRVMRLPAPGRG